MTGSFLAVLFLLILAGICLYFFGDKVDGFVKKLIYFVLTMAVAIWAYYLIRGLI